MRLFPKGKFTWILILFLAYVYYKEYFVERKAPQNNDVDVVTIQSGSNNAAHVIGQPSGVTKTDKLSDKVVNTLKHNETARIVIEALAKKAIEDKYGKGEVMEIAARKTGTLAVVDVIRGAGQELRCGAEAVVNYNAYMSNGMKFDSTKAKDDKDQSVPVTIHTGKNPVVKGLEAGMIGMHEGGRRKISIPSELAFNNVPGLDNNIVNKEEVLTYDVELVRINDGPYKNGFVVEVIHEDSGNGERVLCGDKVRVKYTFIKSDGILLQDGYGETEFTVGGGSMPMGIEFAVLGMHRGGKRTVSIPYKLIKIAEKSALAPEIKFTADEPVKVDIEVIEPKS